MITYSISIDAHANQREAIKILQHKTDHSRLIFRKSLIMETAETQVKSDGHVDPKIIDYSCLMTEILVLGHIGLGIDNRSMDL